MIILLNFNVIIFDIYNKVIFNSNKDYKLIIYFDTQYYKIYNLLIIDLLFVIIYELFVFFNINEVSLFINIDIFDNIINTIFIDNQDDAYVLVLFDSLFIALFNNDYIYFFYSDVFLYLLLEIY